MSAEITGWHKSTRSGNQGNCVECGQTADGRLVGVRDTKQPGPVLVIPVGAWRAFIDDVKAGRFDL